MSESVIQLNKPIQATSSFSLDARESVNYYSDISGIKNPFVGMLIYVKNQQAYYTVKSLSVKTSSIGMNVSYIDPEKDIKPFPGNTGGSGSIGDYSVASIKIGTGAVTEDKIQDGAVTSAKIGNGAVLTSNIGSSQVDTDRIKAKAVTTRCLADNAVTTIKLSDQSVTIDKILGKEIVEEWLSQDVKSKLNSKLSAKAADITFNSSGTGLSSTNVQSAIAEVKKALDDAAIEGGGSLDITVTEDRLADGACAKSIRKSRAARSIPSRNISATI